MSTVVPTGAGAVMASRATAAVPGALDYFPTPPWGGRAIGELITLGLGPHIAAWDPGANSCWEPACGEGHLAHGLADYFPGGVFRSDVFDYGAGFTQLDFLSNDARDLAGRFDWIITNPPFVAGEAFARQALPLARRGVALLLRLQWLESADRYQLLEHDAPLSILAPFAERVPMVKGRWDPAASSATAYAWFVWLKCPPLTWFDRRLHSIVFIPPGTKSRLSRQSDLDMFVRKAAGDGQVGPLFGGADG